MEVGPMIIQAGLLICSAAAIAMTTRSSLMIRRAGAVIGIVGQTFWFMWLDPKKDFGAFILAVWYLGVFGRVLYETFKKPLSVFIVKVRFHNPNRSVKLRVLASTSVKIFKASEAFGAVVPYTMEVAEAEQDEIPTTIELKQLNEKFQQQQRIQQSEQVVPH